MIEMISNICKVRVKLKKKCFNQREGLYEARYKGRLILIPNREIEFELIQASDITSLWTIILDINEVQSISIVCDNVSNSPEFNEF